MRLIADVRAPLYRLAVRDVRHNHCKTRETAMAINHVDGRFALFCWLDGEGEGEPDQMEFSDSEEELRERAEKITSAGRFKYLWLGKLNAAGDDFDQLDEYPN